MRRRDFIAAVAGAIAWPLAARAQQDGRILRIGVMMQIPGNDPESQARIESLLRGLEQFGWSTGRNLRVEYRGTADVTRIQLQAAELIATGPDIILAVPGINVQELQKQTRTIPIVFVNIGDPVEAGIVASLARPGGNTTGFVGGELSMGGKWLELLKEIAPQMNQVLVMTNPNSSNMGYLQVIENSARAVGVRVSSSAVRNAEEIESAINAIAQEANSGLIAVPGGPITVHRRSIFATTARHRLPAIYGFRYYAAEGGLISYGADVPRPVATSGLLRRLAFPRVNGQPIFRCKPRLNSSW